MTFKIYLIKQIARPDSFVVEIGDSDIIADRNPGGKVPMDVIGYVVQFKQPNADWNDAEEREFQRSNWTVFLYM